MLLIDTPINIEFYFTFDGLIVIHNTDYKIVQYVYITSIIKSMVINMSIICIQ